MTPLPRTLLALALAARALAAAASPDPATLLKDADRYRAQAGDLRVETRITTHHPDGSLDKDRRYTVYTQSQHRSLVLMRSPAEAGQKVLMLGDDFWLLLPGSARAMRITPAQKLLGEASTGDIATLSWSEDYTGSLAGEERCDGQPCWHLTLAATRRSASYQRIELWVGTARHEPIRAELYVQSEKLAKLARFVMDKPEAPTRVDEMLLTDKLGGRLETRVRYLSRQPHTVPEAWLNPMVLARNPALE